LRSLLTSHLNLLTLCACLGLPNIGWTQESELYIYMDNDLFNPMGTSDGNYSAGLGLSGYLNASNGWGSSLANGLFFQNNDTSLQRGLAFGVLTFTPNNLRSEEVVATERPYANMLYLGQQKVWQNNADRVTKGDLVLGVLGLGFVEDLQTSIHDATDSEDVNGWQNQISDGGEATGLIRYSSVTRLYGSSSAQSSRSSARLALAASAGYVTEVSVGISGRWSNVDALWWRNDYDSSDYARLDGEQISSDASGIEFIWGARVGYRAYDAFLEGQSKSSMHTFERDELESTIVTGWLGVNALFDGWSIGYVLHVESNQLEPINGEKWFSWGKLNLSMRW